MNSDDPGIPPPPPLPPLPPTPPPSFLRNLARRRSPPFPYIPPLPPPNRNQEVLLNRADMMTSVYVSGLPDDLLGVHVVLEEVFGTAGIIKELIMREESDIAFKSDAIVIYEDRTAAETAVACYNNTKFFGKRLRVRLAFKSDRPGSSAIDAILVEEGHWHCRNCILSSCSERADECPVKHCPNGCGAAMHTCKVEEHLLHVCLEMHIPCTNAVYGCEELIKRGILLTHVEHCPASILMCRFSHDRMSVDFLGKKDSSPRELLLDEKFLLGDLAVLRDRNRAVGCSDELLCGSVRYMKDDSSNQPSSSQDIELDLQCTVGIVTNASQSSQYHIKSLKPRQRTCIDMEAKLHHNYIKREVVTKRCCAFPCNDIIRRDELAAHWKTFHLDIQIDMPCIVERCPMHIYGCMYGEQRLSPNPQGSSLHYDPESDCFLLKPPETIATESKVSSNYAARIQTKQELALYGYEDESEESVDVLGQLPAEILMVICEFLDSQTLWHFSQVNHYLRKVCLNVVKRKGIVYYHWVFNETTQRWSCGPKIWSFSKVLPSIPSWSYTPTPSMSAHMMSCEYLKASVVPYEPRPRALALLANSNRI